MNININKNDFVFIPLGGAEQFGVNLNAYGYDDQWLIVDCGMGFADHRFPGIDLLLPDPSFLEARAKNIVGMFVTHAHEDHIGAVARLWPRLKCQIYCTGFTASVLREKLQEVDESRKAIIHEVASDGKITLGPFQVQCIPVSHSIPDSVALSIKTKLGLVVHSGDWNLDPSPVLGGHTNKELLKAAGREGVLAYIGDSTNAPVAGRTISESNVETGLIEVFKECHGRIGITMFASNIARIQTIAKAAKSVGRSVAVVGRSLHRMMGCAIECGYLRNLPDFIDEDALNRMARDKVVVIVTGSQGESRAALARIAKGDFNGVEFTVGDTVIFSSRAIPGNEKEINDVKNNLISAGVRVVGVENTDHLIHVSGHPYRDDIIEMLGWVKPQIVIPVHGERQQLEAHADIARACQVPYALVPHNGAVIKLAPGTPGIVGTVETGLLAVEPSRIISSAHASIVERRKLQFSGAVHVTLVLNRLGELAAEPQVSALGLLDENIQGDKKFLESLLGEVEDCLADLSDDDIINDGLVCEHVRVHARRFVAHQLDIKPKVTVHLVRV